ncbi:MAG: amidohydrolase family protein [Nitrososphaerales archaeon]|nr:amidohydrolase family protein [Nitrososphaerales archaeon]
MNSIDFHVHPWTKSFMLKNGPIVKACEFFRLDKNELPTSIDDLLTEMESADVSRAVILGQDAHATRNPSFKNYTMKNEELARIASRSGGRLVPFAGVDPNSGAEAVRELKRAFVKLGLRGLKVHSSANSVYPNDPKKMYPLYEVCEERGAPVLLHTGTTGLGDCEIKFSKPEYLDEVCQRFPDLKVVMAHFGWPWSDVAIAIAMRNPNVYLDVSGWRPRYLPSNLLTYINGPLQDRFVFGTDYPMLRQKEWMDDFEASLKPKLKPGVADKLLRTNAESLLGD